MPRFYFHLATPAGRLVDDVGGECASAETAYLEARQSALEIYAEAMRRGEPPVKNCFEICDEAGAVVIELPFTELFKSPPPLQASVEVTEMRIAETVRRSREFHAAVCESVTQVRTALATTRSLLESCR